jgi:hypothetical protein
VSSPVSLLPDGCGGPWSEWCSRRSTHPRVYRGVSARSRLARLKDREQSKDALISYYASLLPEVLSRVSPEEKKSDLRMKHLHVLPNVTAPLLSIGVVMSFPYLDGVLHQTGQAFHVPWHTPVRNAHGCWIGAMRHNFGELAF